MSFWKNINEKLFKDDPKENSTAGSSVLPSYKSAEKPTRSTSAWDSQLKDIIDKIQNREQFSYDLNGDALYQQYKDKFIQQGKLAMGDAIGQASAMTGGYGNSYAQSVGQQAYQAQMNNLNDVIPELYQMAYDMHNQKGQELYDQFSMLSALDEKDYSRYRDEVSDWQADRSFKYAQERDKVSDELTNAKLYYDSEGAAGYDNGSVSEENIKIMQKYLGLDTDGRWGSGATEAVNGLSADQAWKAYNEGTLKRYMIPVEEIKADIKNFIAHSDEYSVEDIYEYIDAHEQEGFLDEAEADELREMIGNVPGYHWR